MCTRKILAREMEGIHRDTTNQELATAIGADPSTVSRFFKFELEFSFTNYLKAVKFLCPDREKEVMKEIISIMVEQEQKQSVRFGMEYLSTSNMLIYLYEVIENQMQAPKENRDWAKCYKLLADHKKGSLDKKELLEAANSLDPKFKETKLFKKILILYAYLRLSTYTLFFPLLNEVEKDLSLFKHEYIRESFSVRLQELKSHAYLYAANDVKKARFYAKNVINSPYVCADFKYNSYYVVGMSYLFEDYEKCVGSLREYVKGLKVSGLRDVEERIHYVLSNDIAFAKILWGIELNSFRTEDILESAHIKIKQGKSEEAIKTLERYEDKEDPFYLCYFGLATNNPNIIVDSLTAMIGKGNKFLANIPHMYLKQFSAYSYIADSIMRNIQIA